MTGKPAPRFKVGDRVKIARLSDWLTDRELLNVEGSIVEVDVITFPTMSEFVETDGKCILQVNYELQTATGRVHYVHDEELEPA